MIGKIKIFQILVYFSISIIIFPKNSFSQYRLEIVKEIKIISFLPIEIVDYYPQDKLYLGYIFSPEGRRVLIINEQGEIKANKILVGEGPNQSSAPFSSLSFTVDGGIWLQSPYQLYLYGQDLNFKKKTRYFPETQIQLGRRMEFFPYFYQNESPVSFSFITNPTNTNSLHPEREKSSGLIEIYNLEKNEKYNVALVTDRAMHKVLDKSLFADLYSIVYTIDRKKHKLYLTTKIDNEITVYDLVSRKLESRIKINHDEFKILEKSVISLRDIPSHEMNSLAPKNNKLFFLDGGMIVLDYIREIPYGTYEKKIADDPTYHHFEDPAYHRLILFDGYKQVSGDIPLPTNGKVTMALPGNRLLIQLINPDVEEDFIRYGVYKIITTN